MLKYMSSMNYCPRINLIPRDEWWGGGWKNLGCDTKEVSWEDQLSTALCSISSKFLCFNFLLDNLGSFKKLVLSLTSGIWIKYLSLSLNHFPLILLTSYLAFSCTTLQPPPYDRRTQCPILPWWWVQVSSSMAHFPPELCEEKRGGHCSILFDLWELSLHQPGLLKEEIPQLSQQPDQHQGPGLTLRPSDLKCGSF